ncbi:MAG: hypothetical protein HGA76_03875 [Candidatus Firestonebacteria bacterium]|nr:hypothetical protein [Candidatus Firestonebacteria bacterium]
MISKIISLFVSVTFIFPYLTWAFEGTSYPAGNAIIFNHRPLNIPRGLGTVQAAYQGGNQLVVHIQDLHCNFEVQTNIARIISALVAEQNLKLVTIEGASGPLNVAQLSNLAKQPRVQQAVGEYFLKQGKLTGAEWAAASSRVPLLLDGIEKAELYTASRQVVGEFLNDESQGYLYDLREMLKEIRGGIYGAALLALDDQKLAVREGEIPLLKYAAYLGGAAQRHGLALAAYPNVSRYVTKVSGQTSEINPDALNEELEALERAVRETMYANRTERELDAWAYRLDIMERLLNISVKPAELYEYRRAPQMFRVAGFLEFVRQYNHGNDLGVEADIFELDKFLEKVGRFYELADTRSSVFVENTLARMGDYQTGLAVLVTGGFHTQAVLQNLKQHNITYISIQPKLTHEDLVNPYYSLLRNRRTPLEKLLAQNQNILALEPESPVAANATLEARQQELSEAQMAQQTEHVRLNAKLIKLIACMAQIAHAALEGDMAGERKRLDAGKIQPLWNQIRSHGDTYILPLAIGEEEPFSLVIRPQGSSPTLPRTYASVNLADKVEAHLLENKVLAKLAPGILGEVRTGAEVEAAFLAWLGNPTATVIVGGAMAFTPGGATAPIIPGVLRTWLNLAGKFGVSRMRFLANWLNQGSAASLEKSRPRNIIDPQDVRSGEKLVAAIAQTLKYGEPRRNHAQRYTQLAITGAEILRGYAPYLNQQGEALRLGFEELTAVRAWDKAAFDKLKKHLEKLPTVRIPQLDLFNEVLAGVSEADKLYFFNLQGNTAYIDLLLSEGCSNNCTFCYQSAGPLKGQIPFPIALKILAELKQYRENHAMEFITVSNFYVTPFLDNDPVQYRDKNVQATLADFVFQAKLMGYGVEVVTHGVNGSSDEQDVEPILKKMANPADVSFHLYHNDLKAYVLGKIAGRVESAHERERIVRRYTRQFTAIMKGLIDGREKISIRRYMPSLDQYERAFSAYPQVKSFFIETHGIENEVWQNVRKNILRQRQVDIDSLVLREAATGIDYFGRGAQLLLDLGVPLNQIQAVYKVQVSEEGRDPHYGMKEYALKLSALGQVRLITREGKQSRYRKIKDVFDDYEQSGFEELLFLLKEFLNMNRENSVTNRRLGISTISPFSEFPAALQARIRRGLQGNEDFRRDHSGSAEPLRVQKVMLGQDQAAFVKMLNMLYPEAMNRAAALLPRNDPAARKEIYALLGDLPFSLNLQMAAQINGRSYPFTYRLTDKDTAKTQMHLDRLLEIFDTSLLSYTGKNDGAVKQRNLASHQTSGQIPDLQAASTDKASVAVETLDYQSVEGKTLAVPVVALQRLLVNQRLNTGGQSNVYGTEYLGQPAVLIIRQSADPKDRLNYSLTDMKSEVIAAIQQANLETYANYQTYVGINYGDHAVAPKIYAVVRNEVGQAVGCLSERVPGRELRELAETGAITPVQLEEVFKQVREQLDLLHGHGLRHGDLRADNVLVDIKPDGTVIARLIDFWETNRNWTTQDETELYERMVKLARWQIQPENVSAGLAKNRARAQTFRKVTFLAQQKEALEKLNQDFFQLKTALQAQEGLGEAVNLLNGMRQTVRVGTKEMRLWTLEDFEGLHQALASAWPGFYRQLSTLTEKQGSAQVLAATKAYLDRLEKINHDWTAFFKPANEVGSVPAPRSTPLSIGFWLSLLLDPQHFNRALDWGKKGLWLEAPFLLAAGIWFH